LIKKTKEIPTGH